MIIITEPLKPVNDRNFPRVPIFQCSIYLPHTVVQNVKKFSLLQYVLPNLLYLKYVLVKQDSEEMKKCGVPLLELAV